MKSNLKNLIIIGTGDLAELAFYFFQRTASYQTISFAVERDYRHSEFFCGQPVHIVEELVINFPASSYMVFVAVGPNKINTVRERLYINLKKNSYHFATYIDQSASVWDPNQIGENSIIFPKVIIEPMAVVGTNCIIWSGSIICHHSIIGNHCFIGPGVSIAGRSELKNNCFLGNNSTIREKIIIEERCIVGAGATIKKNTIKNGVYSNVGTPLLNSESLDTHL